MAKYKVPTLFLNDHLNRCDDCYENKIQIIAQGKLLTEVELDKITHQDLLSDAEVYADLRRSEEYQEMPNLINSAINTVKRLVQING
jgi:hypothetical protein